MALSQAYQEWEQQTERRGVQKGVQQGVQEERQDTIANVINLRFGAGDGEIQAIIPALMTLPNKECMRLLFQSSREELLQRFSSNQ